MVSSRSRDLALEESRKRGRRKARLRSLIAVPASARPFEAAPSYRTVRRSAHEGDYVWGRPRPLPRSERPSPSSERDWMTSSVVARRLAFVCGAGLLGGIGEARTL